MSSGVLLALSAFKYTTIAPLAFVFVFRRWWRPIALAVILHVLATMGCGLYLHESPLVLVMQSVKVGAGLTGHGMCDISSFMWQLGVDNFATWAIGGYVLFGLLLLGLAFCKRRDDLLGVSVLAVISNVMFYHRDYDLVTLIFPLAYVIINQNEKSASFKMLKWTSFVVIGWFFYGLRILFEMKIFILGADFVLMHLLLVAFLIHFVSLGKLDTGGRRP